MRFASERIRLIFRELRAHLPFTLIGVTVGIVVLGAAQWLLTAAGRSDRTAVLGTLFHTFHFTHVFASAIASTAIFFRHERNLPKTILIGFFGTLIPCGLSDILLPFLGGLLLGIPMKFHLCLVEEPLGVFIANLTGILVGLISEARFGKISYFSHTVHVFVSSFASLFYLAAYGPADWLQWIVGIFTVAAVAVVIPCCSSDIVIPLSFVSGIHGHEHEDEHTGHGPT